jgi:hypothetical protein
MISQRDYNWTMAQLFKGQYEEALRNRNNGTGGVGEWQIQNLLHQWQLFEGQAASDTATSMFARNQFETPWTTFNEMARLDTSGRAINLASIMPAWLASQNTGGRWGGFTATPIGTNFGGGINLDPGGGYERHISNTAPSDANRASAFSNPFNRGDLRSAHDFGSYTSPLLRSGANDHFAVARINGGGSMPFGNPSVFSGDTSRNWQELTRGDVVRPNGSIYNPADDWASRYDPDHPNYKFGGATQQAAFPLMNDLADLRLPPQVEAMIGNIGRAHEMMDHASPFNLLPQNMVKNAAMNAASSFVMNPATWRGNGDFSSWYGQASQTSWFNRSMSPMNFGAAARLFGGRAMRHGGLPHRGEPLIVGEAGAELFVPQSQGRIVPNTAFDADGSGGGMNVTINTHTVAPLRVKQQKTPRGLEVIIDDALDAAFQRSGSARDRLQQEYDVRRRPVPRS